MDTRKKKVKALKNQLNLVNELLLADAEVPISLKQAVNLLEMFVDYVEEITPNPVRMFEIAISEEGIGLDSEYIRYDDEGNLVIKYCPKCKESGDQLVLIEDSSKRVYRCKNCGNKIAHYKWLKE